jgi:hypothetical protein
MSEKPLDEKLENVRKHERMKKTHFPVGKQLRSSGS